MKTDVIVIGAGAIGLSLAYELATRGRTVTVVERDPLVDSMALNTGALSAGGNATIVATPLRSASSWAASGILPPANLDSATDPIDRLRGLSHQLFPQFVERLKSESGIDPQLDRCGGWYLSDTIGETASMVGMMSYWSDLSIECQQVAISDLVQREPAIESWAQSSDKNKAWWVPDEYQIRTPMFLQALLHACQSLGVTVLDQSKVVDLAESQGGVAVSIDGNSSPRQTAFADQAVVCGGAWSGLVSESMRLQQSLVPVRGQILLLKTESPILSSIINIGHRYLVPRRDGVLLIGSSQEEVGFQHGTTPHILSDLREFACRICPPLRKASELAAWSGLRPMTFDGFPMCGKLPESDSIFVATGHFRSGIHLSPGTAICLADLMMGQTPPIDLDAFRVGKQQLHS